MDKIFAFLLPILRMLLGIGQPSAVVVASKEAATATVELKTEEVTTDELQAAAAARAAADAQRVRDDPNAGHVTADPKAGINVDPDAHFRD